MAEYLFTNDDIDQIRELLNEALRERDEARRAAAYLFTKDDIDQIRELLNEALRERDEARRAAAYWHRILDLIDFPGTDTLCRQNEQRFPWLKDYC